MPTRTRQGWLLICILAACSGTTATDRRQQDREHYAAGVADGDPQPRLAHCQAIEDPDLHGDCLGALVHLASELPGTSAQELCEGVRLSPWKEECFFVAAEQARKDGEIERAADLCLRTDLFLDDCSVHLWQQDLRNTILPEGIQILVEHHDVLEAFHARWAKKLNMGERFDRRFWDRAYQLAFERQGPLQIGACHRVPEDEQPTCLRAAEQTYRVRLERALGTRLNLATVCAMPPEEFTPEYAARRDGTLAAPNHPRLRELLKQSQIAWCSDDASPFIPKHAGVRP